MSDKKREESANLEDDFDTSIAVKEAGEDDIRSSEDIELPSPLKPMSGMSSRISLQGLNISKAHIKRIKEISERRGLPKYFGCPKPEEFYKWVAKILTFLNDLPDAYMVAFEQSEPCSEESDAHYYNEQRAYLCIIASSLDGDAGAWFDKIEDRIQRLQEAFELVEMISAEFVMSKPMNNVTDKTNFSNFARLMKITAISALDTLLWGILNCAVFFLFTIACCGWWLPPIWPGWWIFQKACDGMQWVTLNFGGGFLPSSVTKEKLALSMVSSTTPRLHDDYALKLTSDGRAHMRKVIKRLQTSEKFSFTLAEFFAQMCALVYESNKVLEEILRRWGRDFEFTRFGRDGCCIMAIWSVEHKFVVLIFKGTGLLDLSEWLTDFSLRKTSPKNGVLPGLVHSGFFSGFGFPNVDMVRRKRKTPTTFDLDKMLEATWLNSCGSMKDDDFWGTSLLPHLWQIVKKFDGTPKPHLWITGHSLGAATASIFTAMILWRRSKVGANSPVENIEWDETFILRGTYTYGTPRTGDTDYRAAIQTVLRDRYGRFKMRDQPQYQFHRIINANDIVATLPGGPGISELGTFFRKTKATTHFNRHSGRYERGNGKPASLTLIDFQHIGTPHLIEYRTGGRHVRERHLGFVLFNAMQEFVRGIPEAFKQPTIAGKAFALAATFVPGVMFFRDHMLSEYVLNLEECRKRNAQCKPPPQI